MVTSFLYPNKSSSISIYWTLPVINKFMQVVLGVTCAGIAAYDILVNFQDLATLSAAVIGEHQLGGILHHLAGVINHFVHVKHVFMDQVTCRIVFLIVTTIFMIFSLVQLTWFPASYFTGSIKSRIIFGLIYHFLGSLSHFTASLFLLGRIDLLSTHFYNIDLMRAVAYTGVVTAVLYLLSIILTLCYFIGDKIFRKYSAFVNDPTLTMESLPR